MPARRCPHVPLWRRLVMLRHQLSTEPPHIVAALPATAEGRIERGHIEVEFEPHPRRVEQMRRFTRSQLRHCGHRDSDAIHMAGVVVSALVTNAIEHAESDTVTFMLACDESGAIRIEVDDHADGRPDIRPFDEDAEDGRGLMIVQALTGAWGRDGSCTWCTIPAAGDEGAR
ncbi:ATP-binding protein [Embleya sp. MST-111070]|uniref:ATP-binding protein n=1 Tax=Embleya sp. MST-111070 TaxID=3398231 RepID=UPI003F740773